VAQAVAQARSGKSVRILLVVLSKPSVRPPGPDTMAPARTQRVGASNKR